MTTRKKRSLNPRIPRWLQLQEEIDYLYFALGQHKDRMPKSPLDRMIDEATGVARQREQSIRAIAARMKALKLEWARETGNEPSTEMEDRILALLGS